MRVCDRHPRKKATNGLVLVNEDVNYDLCDECVLKIEEFMSSPKAQAIDKQKKSFFGRKDSAQAG